MNERILKLLLSVLRDSPFAGEIVGSAEYGQILETFTLVDAEKFALLIVKECADLFDDPESGTRYTGVACRGLIKHYFGVEE